MIVELISVGTELLLGDIVNTDVQYLSKVCAELGFNIYHTSVVGDNDKRLRAEIEQAASRSDIIILSGGLGSTSDDITKRVAMDYVGGPRKEDPETKERHAQHYADDPEFFAAAKDIYTFPEKATVLRNPVGMSPGAWMPFDDRGQEKYLIVLPGPPNELRGVMEKDLIGLLRQFSTSTTRSREVKIALLGEWKVFQAIQDLADHSTEPTFATYVKAEGVLVRMTTQEPDQDKAEKILDQGQALLKERLGHLVLGVMESSREEALVDLLAKEGATVSTAESFTGGMVASRIINAPGASSIIKEAYVVYSDEAKEEILGIDPELIKDKTAVSEEVCRAMLEGLQKKTACDLAIATTGFAGPGGDRAGQVFIGLAYKGESHILEYHWDSPRNRIRQRATNRAIDYALLMVKEGIHGESD